jgi:hypothetical protein
MPRASGHPGEGKRCRHRRQPLASLDQSEACGARGPSGIAARSGPDDAGPDLPSRQTLAGVLVQRLDTLPASAGRGADAAGQRYSQGAGTCSQTCFSQSVPGPRSGARCRLIRGEGAAWGGGARHVIRRLRLPSQGGKPPCPTQPIHSYCGARAEDDMLNIPKLQWEMIPAHRPDGTC